MIRLGICTGIENAPVMKAIGYDYVELNLAKIAQMSDCEYAALKEAVKKSPLPVEATNVMFPGSTYVLCSEDCDSPRTRAYIEKAFSRAGELGVKVMVFGSGAARRVPEGMTLAQGYQYLRRFLNMAFPIAVSYGIRIAIEPLQTKETNIINHVAEAQYLAQDVVGEESEEVAALADLYHMMMGNEDAVSMLRGVIHCHIADRARRFFPKAGDGSEKDYEAFFAALKAQNYEGRVSVEGSCTNFAKDAKEAYAVLNALRQ